MKLPKHIFPINVIRACLIAAGAIVVGVVTVNAIYSQTISPLYFNLINEDRKSIITYLINIKNTPLFTHEFLKYKNTYGGWVENEVFRVDQQRNQQIQKLEEVLNKNQQSRDILYELFLLYQEKGDNQKAQEYYQRARAIDPNI